MEVYKRHILETVRKGEGSKIRFVRMYIFTIGTTSAFHKTIPPSLLLFILVFLRAGQRTILFSPHIRFVDKRGKKTMRAVRISYDPTGDILYVTFGQPITATGYQLSDQLLLRVDAQSREAAGLTIFNFSIHEQDSQGIPLPGLSGALADNPLLLQTLASPPVSHFLKLVKRKQGTCALLRHPSLQEALVA
jgi:uncharacterized protein YuzE